MISYFDDMRTTDIVKPYRVQLVHDDDDRLVGVNIRASEGAELDPDMVREATRALSDHFRREQLRAMPRRPIEPLPAVHAAVSAYREAQGRITDEYLARLALAYEQLVAQGRSAAVQLSLELGEDGQRLPLPTIRTHIKRARDEKFLSPTTRGRETGKATDKARDLIAEADKLKTESIATVVRKRRT